MWIQTYTGKRFRPLSPDIDDICIEDIAQSLSKLCRFNGHCSGFYSVADHCCNVALLLDNQGLNRKLQLWGLMHDASEAYFGDIVSPLKRQLWASTGTAGQMLTIQSIENQILKTIAGWIDLPFPIPYRVKQADLTLLSTEKRYLMLHTLDWGMVDLPTPLHDPPIRSISPETSLSRFMASFNNLTGQV